MWDRRQSFVAWLFPDRLPRWIDVALYTHLLNLPAWVLVWTGDGNYLSWSNLTTLSIIPIMRMQYAHRDDSSQFHSLSGCIALSSTMLSAGSFSFHRTEELHTPGHVIDIASMYVSRVVFTVFSLRTILARLAPRSVLARVVNESSLGLTCAAVFGVLAEYGAIHGTALHDYLVVGMSLCTFALALVVRYKNMRQVVSARRAALWLSYEGAAAGALCACAVYNQGELADTFPKSDERYFLLHGQWHVILSHLSSVTIVAFASETTAVASVTPLLLCAEFGLSAAVAQSRSARAVELWTGVLFGAFTALYALVFACVPAAPRSRAVAPAVGRPLHASRPLPRPRVSGGLSASRDRAGTGCRGGGTG